MYKPDKHWKVITKQGKDLFLIIVSVGILVSLFLLFIFMRVALGIVAVVGSVFRHGTEGPRHYNRAGHSIHGNGLQNGARLIHGFPADYRLLQGLRVCGVGRLRSRRCLKGWLLALLLCKSLLLLPRRLRSLGLLLLRLLLAKLLRLLLSVLLVLLLLWGVLTLRLLRGSVRWRLSLCCSWGWWWGPVVLPLERALAGRKCWRCVGSGVGLRRRVRCHIVLRPAVVGWRALHLLRLGIRLRLESLLGVMGRRLG